VSEKRTPLKQVGITSLQNALAFNCGLTVFKSLMLVECHLRDFHGNNGIAADDNQQLFVNKPNMFDEDRISLIKNFY